MSVSRALIAGACLLSATGFAAADAENFEAAAIPALPTQEVLPIQPAPIAQPAEVQPAQTPAPEISAPAPAAIEAAPPVRTAASTSGAAPDRELTCLAKVVLHEAGNQSRAGQLAVAQVVMNRVRSPRFPNTICGVALQRGQFFNVDAYNPAHDGRWHTALDVARDARDGRSAPVVGGALFFRTAQGNATFFRTRTRVASLGDHIFYR
jgi:N-acetylmuramoyl-L-alanine amidase